MLKGQKSHTVFHDIANTDKCALMSNYTTRHHSLTNIKLTVLMTCNSVSCDYAATKVENHMVIIF